MAEILIGTKPTKIAGTMPAIGADAPDFVLVNKALKNHSLKNYGKERKVLFIVPSLDTAICESNAIEANKLAQQYPNVAVLVISCDLPFAQSRICEQHDLQYIKTLSLMRNKKFAIDYGVLIEEGMMQGVCARAVVVIDELSQIVYTELVQQISDLPNLSEVEEYLAC